MTITTPPGAKVNTGRVPGIPNASPSNTLRALQRVIEVVNDLLGVQDPMNRAIRITDLIKAGVLERDQNGVLTLASAVTTGGTGGAGVWGSITGTLADQTDLQDALDALQAAITAEASARASADTAHAAALDPHPQYLTPAEGNAAYDALGAAAAAQTAAQSYADGLVVDSIANGDTTHAPSRNAVYDALQAEESARIAADALKQDKIPYGTVSGTADALLLDFTPNIAYTDALLVRARALYANTTTTPTANADGLGALTIKKKGGQALAAGDIAGANHELLLVLVDNLVTQWWELLNPASDATTDSTKQVKVQFQDEGANLGASGDVDTVDFVGSGVSAARAGNKVTVTVAGGSGSGDAVSKTVSLAAHGHVVGNIVAKSSSSYPKADRDDSTLPAHAMVSAVADANTFTATTFGKVTLTTGQWDAITGDSGGLVTGEHYWLSSTAGYMTKTAPTTGLRQYVGQAMSSTEFHFAPGEVVDLGSGFAATITAWQSEATTITAVTTNPTKGTIVADKIYWRRVGDSMECRVDYQQSSAGTAGSGKYLFKIPGGYTIDTNKVRLSPNTYTPIAMIGVGGVTDQSTYSKHINVSVYDTTKVQVGDYTTGYVGSANGPMSATAYAISFSFTVPIVGWG